MWTYKSNNYAELYHYGVPGMKWGERKAEAKAAYKNAKQAEKDALNRFNKTSYFMNKASEVNEAATNYTTARINTIKAKADYNAAKKRNEKAAEKAEFKTYRNEMYKTGMPLSEADTASGGRSTDLYNELVKSKGEEYANKVVKSARNKAVVDIIAKPVVTIGATVVAGILLNSYNKAHDVRLNDVPLYR